MAKIEDLEAEAEIPEDTKCVDIGLLKNNFLIQYSYMTNRQRMAQDLDKLIEIVRKHR